jgi:hypothetical protein
MTSLIRRSLLPLVLVIVGCATIPKTWTSDDEIARTDTIIQQALLEMASQDQKLSEQEQLRARVLRLAMLLSTASYYISLQDPEIRSIILHAAQLRHRELVEDYQRRQRDELKSAPIKEQLPPDRSM